MPDKIKERDFVECDCQLGGYSLHCSKEQLDEILKHQRISLAVQKLAKSYDTIPYQLMIQYETFKQNEQQTIKNQNIVKKLESRIDEIKIQLETCNHDLEFCMWSDEDELQNLKEQKLMLESEIKIYSTILNINEIPGAKP